MKVAMMTAKSRQILPKFKRRQTHSASAMAPDIPGRLRPRAIDPRPRLLFMKRHVLVSELTRW
jgi:hypothetical protein